MPELKKKKNYIKLLLKVIGYVFYTLLLSPVLLYKFEFSLKANGFVKLFNPNTIVRDVEIRWGSSWFNL